jgi:hypothetical protein
MVFRRSMVMALLAALLALAGGASQALARGAVALGPDACLLYIGPDYAYFSGYDPRKPRKRYCEEVPRTGDTVFAIDFAQPEMREMKVDFRILNDIGENADPAAIEAATLAHAPAKPYPTGSLSLAYDFKDPGNYAGLVTVDGPHGEHWTAYFPFTVERPYWLRLPLYILGAAGLLAMIVFVWQDRGGGRKPKGKA